MVKSEGPSHNTRFKKIAVFNADKVCLKSPVELLKGALLFDNKINKNVLQLKFYNVSHLPVKSVYIKICCYDDSGDIVKNDSLDYLNYAYIDINAAPHEAFGTKNAIPLPSETIRKFDIYIEKIVMADGSIIRLAEKDFIDIPGQKAVNEVIANIAELKRIEKEISLYNEIFPVTYMPQMYDNGTWSCTCGRLNSDIDCCIRCNRSKQIQFSSINEEYLRKSKEQHEIQLLKEQKEKEYKKKVLMAERKANAVKVAKASAIVIVLCGLAVFCSIVVLPYLKYNKAERLMNSNSYQKRREAYLLFSELHEKREYKDSYFMSHIAYKKMGEITRVVWKNENLTKIEAEYVVLGLKDDGSVIVEGLNDKNREKEISKWKDIVDISSDIRDIYGVKKDGTIVASYSPGNERNLDNWKDIIKISAGSFGIIGLRKDGTVVRDSDYKKSDKKFKDWHDIVEIAEGRSFTAGLKSDGTVVAVGFDEKNTEKISRWNDIVAISGIWDCLAGLKKDGTVVIASEFSSELDEVASWKDIVQVSAGMYLVVGLKKDGSIVAASFDDGFDEGIKELARWKDIVSISAGMDDTVVGVKKDGTVVSVGLYDVDYNH